MTQQHSKRFWKKILQDWSLEIIALVLVILGISIFSGLSISKDIITPLKNSLQGIAEFLSFVLVLFEPRNLSAIALILFAFTIIGRRIRYRLMRTPRFVLKKCPVCGHSLSRRHRHRLGHLVNHLIPIGRYGCKKCGWDGWRIRVQ